MKQIILVLTLIFITSAKIVRPATDQCACNQIMTQADCQTISSCEWTPAQSATIITPAIPGQCVTPTPTLPTTYCQQIAEPAINCWKTFGCAYINSQCSHFSGCTAYVKTTNSDCQAISKYCITDGAQCINAKSCNEYLTEIACETNFSISGILKCKWDNSICRDYVCTEADSTLKTDAACNAWLSGCVTTGKGCIASLGTCSSYIGDDAACSGLIGTDGNCEGTPGGINCNARFCIRASAFIGTDNDCFAYQIGCITNGKGCVLPPLPTCSTYQGDNTTCIGYIGSDGVCEGNFGGINCRSRLCTNAPASHNTDQLCSAYKLGCVTTGKGCDTSRSACGGYSGTIYSCIGYIGSDGYCQGTNDTISSPCTAKVCNDAPTTTSTDQACGQYQIGCKTTGKGCTSSLGRCSSYSGTTTACEGYIGNDGKCKGTLTDTAGPCTPKLCNEAPLSIVTNEACGQYQTGCVTNGSGCIPQLSCLDTIKKISCEGTPGCGWNNICVSSQYCSDFNTVSICEGNNSKAISGSTGSNIPCHWTGTYCRNLACTDAPVTHNTDNLCNLFLAGCLTNGKGCLSPSASCSQYFGDRKACSEFTKKCWNLENASLTSACNERVCTDDTNSIADSACDSFKTGCRTKGQGCIDPQMPCSSYSGTQQQCDAFKGNYGQIRCWALSTTASSSCLDKSCAHLTLADSDADCETFLSGCLYNGVGCVPKSSSCGSYIGTQSQCGNFKGTNYTKICWSTNAYIAGSCIEKECVHASSTSRTNADCEQFLTGCLTNGQGCVPASTPCSSYFGTITECERFVGNLLPCYNKDACADKVCSDKLNPKNDADCQNYLSTCRYFNGSCVGAGPCYFYSGTSLAQCQDILDIANTKCWWTSGSSCISRTCSTVPDTVTNQAGCDSHILNCVYAGLGTCVPKGVCNGYLANGTSSADKLNNCLGMIDINGKYCCYTNGESCESKTCWNVPKPISGQQNCDSHVLGCRFNGSSCVTVNICSNYVVDGTDTEKSTQCKYLTDINSKACWWITGNTCSDRSCSSAILLSPSTQSTCDAHIFASCVYQTSCIRLVCQLKTNATQNSDCTTHNQTCRFNGNAICIAEQASCNNYVLDSSLNSLAYKQTICEALTDSNAKKCSYDGTGKTCIVRTCAGKTTYTANQAACTAWMPTCRFIGKTTPGGGCQDSNSTCAYTLDASVTTIEAITQLCEQLSDSVGNFCMAASSGSTCVARTCIGKTTATANQAACAAWMPTCRFTGKTTPEGGCQDASSDCKYTLTLTESTAAVVCLTLTDLWGNYCMGGIEPNCVARTCEGLTATSDQLTCNAWMPTCQFREKKYIIEGIEMKVDCFYRLDASITAPSEIARLCEQLSDAAGNKCMGSIFSGPFCEARTCVGKTTVSVDQAACAAWMPTCRFTGDITAGGGCKDSNSNCAYVLHKSIIAFVDVANICEQLTDIAGNKCMASSTESTCVARTCQGKITSTANQAECAGWISTCRWTGKTTAGGGGCQDGLSTCTYTISSEASPSIVCPTLTDLGGKICMAGIGQNCADRTCAGKINASSHTDCNSWKTGCQWTGKASGNNCADPDTCYNCEQRNCSNILNPTSNQNCIDWLSTCRFTGTYCVTEGNCSSYHVSAGSDLANRTICEGIKNASGILCAYVNTQTTCSERYCPLVSTVAQSTCISWLGTSCRWDGTQCLAGGACDSYIVVGETDEFKKTYCMALTDTSDPPLPCGWSFGYHCTHKDCLNVFPVPITDSDCQTYLPSCRLTNTQPASCIPKSSSCSQYIGTPAQCKAFKGVNDTIPCWSTASENSLASCIDKQCNHNTTATTNSECIFFLSNCKTNGLGCVTNSTPCSTLSGNALKCTLQLSNDGINFCKIGSASACSIKSCYDDGFSTTDTACQAFMSDCLTNGNGCVLNSDPCSIYQGTQVVCSTYTGKFKKCWNIASADSSTFCVDKKCSDDYNSTTDDACKSSLNGCVTKGIGCIEDSASCSAYQGTQATCQRFKGNKLYLCWNIFTATTTTPCIEKACSHNTVATSDTDCENFLPRSTGATIPRCVTSGTGCVDYQSCSQFTGTLEQCSRFTAMDGPCKTTAAGSIAASGTCTPRICTEASNSYNTDALCQAFHPSCVTTGYGCAISVSCPTIQEMNSCSAKRGCSWVNNCRSINNDCSSQTAYGASVCVNTPVSTGFKKCSWSNNACRAQTIDDFIISTHQGCQAISTLYTTTGEGCTLMGPCIIYSTEKVCKVAMTTDVGYTCIWDTGIMVCRAKQCTDAPKNISTDYGCEAYLTGCRTNGIDCIAKGFRCQSLLTATSCIKDDQSMPCLWVNGACYNFSKCEDIQLTTHEECQVFSPLCTTSGTQCIAITTCEKTTLQQSCKVGSDGICGWLPTQKCHKFKTCSDADGIDDIQCSIYGSNCIMDGTKCIDKVPCSNYLKQIACHSQGTDVPQCEMGYYYNLFNNDCLICDSPCLICTTSGDLNCCDCLDGYYLDGKVCQLCSQALPNCSDCSNSTTCLNCVDETYYISEGKCISCQNRCKKCNNSATCTECLNGKYLDSNGICQTCLPVCSICHESNLCDSCIQGYYLSNQICQLCQSPCTTCTSLTQCTGCIVGKYLSGTQCLSCDDKCLQCTTNSTTCQACKSGYFLLNSECKQCQSPCSSCIDTATKCLSCKDQSYYLENDQCQSCQSPCKNCHTSQNCIDCLTTFYNENGKCVACNQPCITCKSATVCETCQGGYYLDSSNTCLTCPIKCSNNCSSSTVCTTCSNGYLKVIDDCIQCTFPCRSCTTSLTHCNSCADEYYLLADGQCAACVSDCIQCPNGQCTACANPKVLSLDFKCITNCEFYQCDCSNAHYFDIALSNCLSCSINCKTCSGQLSNQCTSCLDEFYYSAGECLSCVTPCLNCTTSTDCDSCVSTHYLDNDQIRCNGCESPCITCNSSGNTNCQSCVDGYYLTNQICTKCDDGCETCIGQSNNCQTCIEGYYQIENQCIKCPIGCKTCISSTQCMVCITDYFLENNLCKQCDSAITYQISCELCTPGQYLNNSTCLDCVNDCKTCRSEFRCTQCFEGYYLSTDKTCVLCSWPCKNCSTSSICISCQDEYYLSNGSCLPCYKGCELCSKTSTTCSKCKDKYFLNNEKCDDCVAPCINCTSTKACKNCIEGYYFDQNTCIICPTGCTTCTNDSTCQTCEPEFYHTSLNDCLPCQAPCLECTDAAVCTSCIADYYLPDTQCLQCPTKCPNKCYFSGGALNCTACAGGYYMPDCLSCVPPCKTCLDKTKCQSCEPQYYLKEQTCTACPSNCKECKTITGECYVCNDGYSMIQNSCKKCSGCPCSPGSYYSESTENCQVCISKCVTCDSPTNCLSCPLGFYLDNGSCTQCKSPCITCSSAFLCQSCDEYHYPDSTCLSCQSPCKKCKQSGNVNCQDCIDGYYLENSICKQCDTKCSTCSLTSCICKPGLSNYYQNGDQCSSCPEFCKTCTSNTACQECESIEFSLINSLCVPKCRDHCKLCSSKNCQNCEAGYYADGKNCNQCQDNCLLCMKTQCSLCLDGYYISGSQCIQCQPLCKQCNSYQCISCPALYYPQGQECIACNPQCNSCNSNSCLQCSDRYYIDNKDCIACESNCVSCNKDACIQCNAKYYADGINCVACQSNCLSCTATKCLNCSSKYFVSEKNCVACQSNCTACTATKCNVCDPQYYVEGQNCIACQSNCKACTATQCNLCDPQYYIEGQNCIACQSNCKACTATQCNLCDPQYYIEGQNCIACKSLPNCLDCTATQCTQCESKYYAEGRNCVACGKDCLSCTSTGCQECPQKYYVSEKNCFACQPKCNSCTNDLCTECESGYYTLGKGCVKCSTNCLQCTETLCQSCIRGYYAKDSNCLSCDQNCEQCSKTSSNCQSCKDNYFLNDNHCDTCGSNCTICTSKTRCLNCIQGYYIDQDQCKMCQTQCALCTSSDRCQECKPTYYHTTQDQCHPCQENCLKCSDDINCTACRESYIEFAGQCLFIPYDFLEDTVKDSNHQSVYNINGSMMIMVIHIVQLMIVI